MVSIAAGNFIDLSIRRRDDVSHRGDLCLEDAEAAEKAAGWAWSRSPRFARRQVARQVRYK